MLQCWNALKLDASIPGGGGGGGGGSKGGPDPPKDMHWGVQRVKDPPIEMNMFAIYHEY